MGIEPEEIDRRISPILATGSTPSGDGLRLLVDAFAVVNESVRVVEVGASGQLAIVELEGQ